jgi:putative two-component system response regulator
MTSSATLDCVLFVDDEPKILKALARACRGEPFEVLTARCPDNAMAILEDAHVSVVVSDQEMPGRPGTEFLSEVRRRFPATGRILLTASRDPQVAADAVNYAGISRLIAKPWDEEHLRRALRETSAACRPRDPALELRRAYLQTVRALAEAVDAKDPYTRGHSDRVAIYASRIATELGATPDFVEQIYLAGLLHDIGKIGIADAILRKPAPLTRAEYAEIQRHPEIGARILEPVEFLAAVVPCVRHHHEWYDGSEGGYPDRLRGDRIPLSSRIILVADAIEAMASDRPYRRGVGLERVAEELLCFRGTQFDPQVTDAFVSMYEREGDEFLAAKFDLLGVAR